MITSNPLRRVVTVACGVVMAVGLLSGFGGIPEARSAQSVHYAFDFSALVRDQPQAVRQAARGNDRGNYTSPGHYRGHYGYRQSGHGHYGRILGHRR